jgi:hypothetical protein
MALLIISPAKPAGLILITDEFKIIMDENKIFKIIIEANM